MLTQFHEKAQKVIVIAESIAFDLGHSHVGSEHILLSLLKLKDSQFVKVLTTYGVNEDVIYNDIVRLFGQGEEQPFYMNYSSSVKQILEDAIDISKQKKQSKVMVNDIMISLLKQDKSVAIELLKKYKVDFDILISSIKEDKTAIYELNQVKELININEKVKKEDRIMIGRDHEISQLCTILCKKEKNNALLIGKAGVGKSALVEKLALLINEHEAPDPLNKKVIYELSLSSSVAGTKYRGEFEEKFKKIIDKVMDAKDAIIFIDEIHNLIGAGGAEGAIDASNILKPYIARGEMTIIGATTLDEYYRYFEKDQAMNRRFSIVKMNENNEAETLEILKGLKPQYMSYHHILIDDDMLKEIISLSKKYLPSRVFPDKAIDILDLSCVKSHLAHKQELSQEEIKQVIEELSGLVIDEEIAYNEIEKRMNQEIIGQNQAIHTLCDHLSKHCSSNIFLLVGSSGIGKTETAKVLSRILHRELIRLDMSEYSDYISVNKIIGSPPGYVGYEHQTTLFNELTLHPHAILLLDEIEKAHPQVLHLFLQGFDEGIIKDSHQRIINLSNCIIVMTSNALSKTSNLGFKKKTLDISSLEDTFSKEFLNRIDEIIYYRNLDMNDLKTIASKYHLSQDRIQELLEHYDASLGARLLTRKISQNV